VWCVGVSEKSALKDVVGDRSAKALQRAFGYTLVSDLLEHYPRRYATRGELTSLQGTPIGEPVSIVAEVVSVSERPMRQRRGSLLEVAITDGTGLITLTFFNQAWRKKDLHPGVRGLFAGKVGTYRGGKQLTHPDYELFTGDISGEESEKWANTPIPLYPATSTLASWQIARAIGVVLDQLEPLQDPVPGDIVATEGLLDKDTALRYIHQPESADQWRQARDTLRFHEAFVLQLALLQQRQEALTAGSVVRESGALVTQFDELLPFSLTEDQIAVGEEISSDLQSGHPMHRLVHGEVGSGKTVVAIRAMLQVAQSGGQTALLAPTEVLATQHFRSIHHTLGPDLATTVRPVLLTGSLSAAEKKKALLMAASGQSLLVVGTHALLSDTVQFADLGLVIVDEQHRFGVEQRNQLRQKGSHPHLLVLTATPIPRTVAMTVFGDLDVSTISRVPSGRHPITTHVVALDDTPEWYGRVWARAKEEIDKGRQVFVVCPAIEPGEVADGVANDGGEGDGEDTKLPAIGVTGMHQDITQMPEFAGITSGIVHGKLSADDKDSAMTKFASGDVSLLVATTVIEVGVDVPNATVMVVMDADRFGISQLHQLRGRVGRGGHPGLCLLVTRQPKDTLARQRLDAVASTTDGFELSHIDLELRNEGDVLGVRQSGGRSGLKLLRVRKDQELIEKARSVAHTLLDSSPDLAELPVLREALERRLEQREREFLAKS
jgi:ATP-dependent DNA helicase RecG